MVVLEQPKKVQYGLKMIIYWKRDTLGKLLA